MPAEEVAEDGGAPAPFRKSRQHAQDDTVIVDLPDPMPITEAGSELLESERADFIAELLKM